MVAGGGGCLAAGVNGSVTIPAAYPNAGCGYSGIVRFQTGVNFFIGEVVVGVWVFVALEPVWEFVEDAGENFDPDDADGGVLVLNVDGAEGNDGAVSLVGLGVDAAPGWNRGGLARLLFNDPSEPVLT